VVFQGFNLSVPTGRTVALVGESGSGKSTVVSLIERFYDPLGGQVLLDGRDIRDLNLHWLRSTVGLVSQEPVLFNMSVADNIRYGRPDASQEAVEEAARAANAHSFVQALPEGYATQLGEGQIQLSGGQKQRIAIARAIVKDPKVLLLDEATSALDAESERVVQEALDRLMVGRTTVVVAHRLSTIRDADSIAVVYKGHIVEQGSHQDLMAKGGSYARLVAHQMKKNV
jgi:ATP-binding cassette subfamily B (MDR/TAP) protein 1